MSGARRGLIVSSFSMDSLRGFGSSIVEQLEPTDRAFEPLLRAHEAEILSFKRKTFRYGATDRHQLDVYFPSITETGSAPILFFVYGGGYVSGARILDPPNDLKYKNTGAFFAKRGFVTVIADYRIFPNIKFPDPPIDIRDALAWVISNIDEVNQGVGVKADASQVFMMGHSAGATTVATLMLVPELLQASLRERILGLVLNAGAYDFRGAQTMPPRLLRQYYGPREEDVRKREPLGLVENASGDILTNFPPVLAVIGEYDFPPLVVSHGNFVPALKEKVTSMVDELVMKGHNHISPYNSLSSGEGEQWGIDVIEWLNSKIR